MACLNDTTEVYYAINAFRRALAALRADVATDAEDQKLLTSLIELTSPNEGVAETAPSKFFVACFAKREDDLSQWRAYSGETSGENGYAIAFRARGLFVGPNSLVAKVNYDAVTHEVLAKRVAKQTLTFFREGLKLNPARSLENWAKQFFEAWDEQIYRLAPLVKNDGFEVEDEFRIVHELQPIEVHQVRFRQKRSLLARYIPLRFPMWMGTRTTMLPIVSIMIGPGRHNEVSRESVRMLLSQMGYANLPVSISKRPLQAP